jgi:hypothetical protein
MTELTELTGIHGNDGIHGNNGIDGNDGKAGSAANTGGGEEVFTLPVALEALPWRDDFVALSRCGETETVAGYWSIVIATTL